MVTELKFSEFERARRLLAPLSNYNLVLESMLTGLTPGRIFVDDPENPASVFAGYDGRVFLAGEASNMAFNQELNRLIVDTLIPEGETKGQDAFTIDLDSAEWEPALDVVLTGRYPAKMMRQYYECTMLRQKPEEVLTPGFRLKIVDVDLLAQTHLENLDNLRDEMCSERPSVEDFLEKSFGFCTLKENELTGWCLSEYNVSRRCEVGVATIEKYQRRGIGTAMSLALVEYALAHGYQRVGWHCWKNNIPSAALATRAGFELVNDYPVYLCLFDLAEQFGVNGNQLRMEGEYRKALKWYEKAMEQEDTPFWVYYNAARCHAQLNQIAETVEALRQALEHGFTDHESARSNPDFELLHGSAAWETLFP